MNEHPKGARRARKVQKRAQKIEKRVRRRKTVESPNWLSPEKCAQDLGVTKQYIYNQIGAGRVKAKRFSTKVIRISREEWERFKLNAPDAAPAA